MPTTPVTKGTRRAATTPANDTVAPKKARANEEAGSEDPAATTPAKAALPPREGAAAAIPAKGDEEVAVSPMHPVSMEEFQQFLQCQLKKEAEVHLNQSLPLKDPGAQALWEEYEAFVRPNLGGTERWVPYHTVLGVHEKFLVEAVHHSGHGWTEHQRFLAIFIFRAHCKGDVFSTAQLPLMLAPGFWKDPKGAFATDGPMEKALLNYRHTTKKALLTLCFRMIPNRILEDDDANIVRNIILRTQTLLEIAEAVYPIAMHETMTPAQKFEEISERIQQANGLGETWAKMLAVCIDMAHPRIGLLASQCNVGVGALAPLRALLPCGGPADHQEALEALRTVFNTATNPTAGHFWDLLQTEEELAREKFTALPLIVDQTNTTRGGLNAGTLQVQLCEYRQFRNALARTRYDLPCDESLKEPEKERRFCPASLLKRDLAEKTVAFPLDRMELGLEKKTRSERESEEKKMFRVSVQAVGDKWRLAERVALLCLGKLLSGSTEADIESLREKLVSNCQPDAEDVPEDHAAWDHCRVTVAHASPLCSFTLQVEGSTKRVAFQTTVKASGGIMEAERLARLCYAKFQAGAEKDEVLAYRNKLYAELQGVPPPQSGRQLKLKLKPKKSALMRQLCGNQQTQLQKALAAAVVTCSEVTVKQKLRELKQDRLLRIGNPRLRRSNEVLKAAGGEAAASQKKRLRPHNGAELLSIMRCENRS